MRTGSPGEMTMGTSVVVKTVTTVPPPSPQFTVVGVVPEPTVMDSKSQLPKGPPFPLPPSSPPIGVREATGRGLIDGTGVREAVSDDEGLLFTTILLGPTTALGSMIIDTLLLREAEAELTPGWVAEGVAEVVAEEEGVAAAVKLAVLLGVTGPDLLLEELVLGVLELLRVDEGVAELLAVADGVDEAEPRLTVDNAVPDML